MYSKRHLYNQVSALRKYGLNLSEIASRFHLAKSTVSMWCKEIKLSETQKKIIKDNWLLSTIHARLKGSKSNRDKKIRRVEEEERIARQMISNLSQRDTLIAGISLYWAEGSKKDTGEGFNFINSDPNMIKFMFSWLKIQMKVPIEKIRINVCINISHNKRIDEILSFWSNLLHFPIEKFSNTIYIRVPHKKVYENEKSYYGMIRIKVFGSSWLRRRINGMIKCLILPA